MRLGQGARLLEVWGPVMEEAIYQLMAVTAGILCGAMMWRNDALAAKEAMKSEDALRRYRWAVDELDRWCGHESPHVRLIAAHITAVGEGHAMNAGTPCGSEVCDIQGTRQQLRGIDAKRAGNRALFNELADISTALGTAKYMDPPDGGSVPLSVQVRRMREELEGLQSLMDDTEWLKAELSTRVAA